MSGRVWAVAVLPMVFQCRLQKLVCPVASQCGTVSIKFLQWHSSVGLFQLNFSSGVPVHPASIRGSPSGIPVYTGSTSGILVAFQCTLDQPVYTGSR